MEKRGLLLVVSAPSGGGKGTILKELFQRNDNLKLSVSATTRAPRPGEEHGKHYYFLSNDEFESMIQNNELLEHAGYVDHYYGTPKVPVDKWLSEGYDVVLEIEVQGGAQVKALRPDCVSVFIMPPSMQVLEERLRGRGTEDEATVQKRLGMAKEELPHAEKYDYIVWNDRVENAVEDILAILKAEKCNYIRNTDCVERVLNNAETV